MHFINENVTTYEGAMAQLDFIFYLAFATAFIIFALMIASVYGFSLYVNKGVKPPIKFTTWLKVITVSTLLSALITTVPTIGFLASQDYYKGHYEASGTIATVTFNKTHAGQAGNDGDFTIGLILDNGDPVVIQMPIDNPDNVVPGAEFTLKSETLVDITPRDDFYPIEDFTYYYESSQSLANTQWVTFDTILVDFIVDGEIVK